MLIQPSSRTPSPFLTLQKASSAVAGGQTNIPDPDCCRSLEFASHHVSFTETIEYLVVCLGYTQCRSNFTGWESQSGPGKGAEQKQVTIHGLDSWTKGRRAQWCIRSAVLLCLFLGSFWGQSCQLSPGPEMSQTCALPMPKLDNIHSPCGTGLLLSIIGTNLSWL